MGISHIYLRDLERGNRTVTDELRAKYLRAIEKPNVRAVA
jgi:acyl-coenzyme A thioesterase PaaI-like protein